MATTNHHSRRKRNYGVAILIILVLSIALGFLLDAGITFIEKKIYPVKYSEYVEKYSKEYNVPVSLLYAVIKTESDFEADAVSRVGAVGLMQFMPATFKDLSTNHLYENLDIGMRYDPETSIKYGAYYLSWIYRTYVQDWETALAAYNAGIGNVFGRRDVETDEWIDGWIDTPEYSDDGITLKKIPFKETRNYVKRVMRAEKKYRELYALN